MRSASGYPQVVIRIGCSGWNYASWRRTFYPQGVPASRRLEHYASVFDTVEVNTLPPSFHRDDERLARALDALPAGRTRSSFATRRGFARRSTSCCAGTA